MNRLVLSIALILVSINLCDAQKTGYTSNFTSSQQIRSYYANNLSLLDPIEGEYDVEFSGEYITPLVHQYLDRDNFKIWIVCNNSVFTIYTDDGGFRKSRLLSMQSVGETNVYTFYYDSTPTRIYLQDLIHFKASLHLNNSSANTFRDAASTAPSVNILPVYDCIKVYPTISMYSSAIRTHVEEETKPTLWTGTGFALTNNYVVTNYHVIEEAKSISIQGINGNFNNKYGATVVATDKINDLAILKVNGVNIPNANIPYSVKTTTSEVGEDVFVLGYPLTSTMGDEIKLTTGVVSSKSGFQGDVSLYQISAPIQPGNSGGPVFDSKGNVIGIVSAKHKGTENVSYAIKTSYLRNLIESSMSTIILPQTNKISNLNLSGKVKSVKNFVYYIICEDNIAKVPTPSNSTYNSSNSLASEYNYDKYIGAANAGDAVAQHKIGRCYFHGIGVKQDYKEAFLWYRKSADNGYKSGLADVGFCYYHGYGVTKDLKQALYWYELAADKGSVAAKSWISTIRKEIQEGK